MTFLLYPRADYNIFAIQRSLQSFYLDENSYIIYAILANKHSNFVISSDIIFVMPAINHNIFAMSLIEQLRTIRQEQGITQAELADMLGLQQSSIARIETGRVETRLSMFEELVKTLGYEILIIPKEQVVAAKAFLSNVEQYSNLSQTPLYTQPEDDEIQF